MLLAVDLRDVKIIGPKGMFVSWLETSIVIVLVFLIGRYLLKVETKDSIATSFGLSICGSSAVVSAATVIKNDEEIVKTIILVMSVFTIPLIPLLPIFGKLFKLNNDTLGSWIGGSIDSIGAVAASSSIGVAEVFRTAIIIKVIQTIWIGPGVMIISAFWNRTVSPRVLWDNFPKFVFGFFLIALVTTFLPNSSSLRDLTVENCFIVSEWFSSMSFVLIGYSLDIFTIHKNLYKHKKILILYLIGQSIDVLTTFAASYLMFTVIA